jgi:hypothetical protein
MGPETIALAAATLTRAALQSLMKNIGTEASKGAGALAKSTFKNWQTDQALQAAYNRSKQVRRVKTIWDVEKERDLLKFYYPSKVRSPGEPLKVVHKIDDFDFDGNLIIRGIVGQGKSIFLRYLAAREFELGERIPLFIELRRIEPQQTVIDAAIEEMKNLGLAGANAEVIDYLAKSSRLVLLLDGFDEVVEEQTTGLVNELENLSVRLPKLRVIVTSRPENAIERSPHFRVFDLAPLVAGEYAQVVARITNDAKLAEEIVTGVRRSHQSIASLLTTPLMVSLLAVRYRVGQGIPENRVAFYEPLFMLLLQRHDSAKAGYKRRRASKLSDLQLQAFFNCLCFITRRDGVSALRENALNSAAAHALKYLDLTGNPPDIAVSDVRRITCLILKDGADEYRFLHKSVQEFHAACFVRDQPDGLSADFYAAMPEKWADWQQELQFLETIHKERYDRFFAVPMLDRVVSTLPGARPREIGEALIGRLTMRVAVQPRLEFQSIIYPRDPVGWCLMKYFDGSKLSEGIAETSQRLAASSPQEWRGGGVAYRDLAGRDVLAALAPSDRPGLDAEAEQLGSALVRELEERRHRMHSLDERKGLFDI